MGYFRFRRSVSLFPGVRINFNKNSTSLTLGGRGFKTTIGPTGTRMTVGIPGTGISYTENFRGDSCENTSEVVPEVKRPRTPARILEICGSICVFIAACSGLTILDNATDPFISSNGADITFCKFIFFTSLIGAIVSGIGLFILVLKKELKNN